MHRDPGTAINYPNPDLSNGVADLTIYCLYNGKASASLRVKSRGGRSGSGRSGHQMLTIHQLLAKIIASRRHHGPASSSGYRLRAAQSYSLPGSPGPGPVWIATCAA